MKVKIDDDELDRVFCKFLKRSLKHLESDVEELWEEERDRRLMDAMRLLIDYYGPPE